MQYIVKLINYFFMKDSALLYSYARNNLKSVFDQVNDNHESILIKCKDDRNVVVVSEEDYDSIMETFYLIKSKSNRKKIIDALNRKGGKSYASVDLIRKEYGSKK